jgi:hypothetical protein
MGTIITGYLSAVGFARRRVAGFDPRSAVASQEELNPEKKAHADGRVEDLNAYKVAVLLAIGAAILSCL